MVGDIGLIVLAVSISVAVRLTPINVVDRYTGATAFVVICYIACYYIFDLYNPYRRFRSMRFLTHFVIAVSAGTILAGAVFYAGLYWKLGRGILLLDAVLIGVFTYLWRAIYAQSFGSIRKKRRVLIAGAGASGRAVYNILKDSEDYSVVGFIDDDSAKKNTEIGAHRVIGATEVISDLVERMEIDAVVVAINREKNRRLISALLDAKLKGVGIFEMESVYEMLTGKLPASHLREGWLTFAELQGAERGIYRVRVKRLVSLAAASLLLIIALPIVVVTIVAIKFDSRGPIFYRQRRVGLNGKIFEIIKFRSMHQNAEQGTAIWAIENDPRVTRVGRVLRLLRIDEIPQLWNIIKGEMSLIGPRPERPEFIRDLQKTIPFYCIRHVVKPGVTGWAQVNYKYGSSKEDALEKLQYDLYYVKNLSFVLDVQILLKTIRVVLFGEGAR